MSTIGRDNGVSMGGYDYGVVLLHFGRLKRPAKLVDVNLAGLLSCPPKLHLHVFQVKRVDVILVGKHIASVFCRLPWYTYKMRCT
jgi:hypothetical protein